MLGPVISEADKVFLTPFRLSMNSYFNSVCCCYYYYSCFLLIPKPCRTILCGQKKAALKVDYYSFDGSSIRTQLLTGEEMFQDVFLFSSYHLVIKSSAILCDS